MSSDATERKRLYVAGLNEAITEDDLKEKFAKYGTVHSVDLKSKYESRFAYVELTLSSKKLTKCLKRNENTSWKGCELNVQLAKESFLSRLKKEQEITKTNGERKCNWQANVESLTSNQSSETLYSRKKSTKLSSLEESNSSSKTKKIYNAAESDLLSESSVMNDDFEIVPLSNSNHTCVNDRHSAKKTNKQKSNSGDINGFKVNVTTDSGRRKSLKSKFDTSLNQLTNGVNESATSPLPRSQKKEISNHRRVESLKNKLAEANARQKLVAESLKKLDAVGGVNKKLVFSNESDEDSPTVSKEKKSRKQTSESTIEKQQMSLFDSSNSDSDEKDAVKDMFRVRPQFEGEAGQKLIELQSRFGNDSRFQLDERFIDDGGEKTEKGQGNEDHDPEFGDVETEKQQQLEVLQDLLGYQAVRSKAHHRKKAMIQDWSRIKRMRYDPENAAELEVCQEPVNCSEVESTKKKKKKKKKEGSIETDVDETKQDLPDVSKERFYEVSDTLWENIGKGKNTDDQQPFSLLASLGIAEPPTAVADSDGFAKGPERALCQPRLAWDVNPFKYDSSDSDDDDKIEKTDEKVSRPSKDCKKEGILSSSHVGRPTFFFFDGDQRLKDGVEFFKQPADMDAIKTDWVERKPVVMEIIRNRKKHALRKESSVGVSKTGCRWDMSRNSIKKWRQMKMKMGRKRRLGVVSKKK